MIVHPAITSVPSVPLSPPASRPGDWSVLGAIGFVALMMVVPFGFAIVAHKIYSVWLQGIPPEVAQGLPLPTSAAFLMPVQLVSQLLQLALVWWLVGRWHGDRVAALNLQRPTLSLMGWVGVIALLFAVKAVVTLIAAKVGGTDMKKEVGSFIEIARLSHVLIVFLGVVVVAGLIEELLFRGILSRTLEATRLGFWLGAALASASFAVVHLQYGVGGQIVVFAIGMTLAWIRARTGSLWPAIACHCVNNSVALLAILAIR